MNYERVRVAVLGASGFIGRWTARKLTEAKAELFLFVRDANFARVVFDRYNIQGKIIKCDFSTSEWENTYESIAHQINGKLPERICRVIEQSMDLKWQGQNLVHAGSALEYGEIAGDLSETSVPNPTTLYGKSKLEGTQVIAKSGIKSAIARLFTVYGPGEHAGRLLPDLLKASRTGKEVKLTAGVQKRDFTFVEDVAEGLLRLGLSSTVPAEIINLATGKLISVREFAETAAVILNIRTEQLSIGALPTRTEEMEHSEVSIRRLREVLGWSPATSITQGIQKTQEFERGSDGI